MIWAGLAVIVMTLTGDGDDTRAYFAVMSAMRQGCVAVIEDHQRRIEAIDALDQNIAAYKARRKNLKRVGDCLEDADRTYEVTAKTYMKCFNGRLRRWSRFEDQYMTFKVNFRKAFTDEEWQALEAYLRKRKVL